MPSKATDRLAKLASFGASAATKQVRSLADAVGTGATRTAPSPRATPSGSAVPAVRRVPMIRNVAFTAQEQEILRVLMDHLREAGELTPNLSLAVKVGLRLIPEHPSPESVRQAVLACKALDGRRKALRAEPGA